MKIENTREYDRFTTLTGNRTIIERKVNRLKKMVAEGLDMFRYCPIIVNPSKNNFVIIDGQHRYRVCRDIGLPVYYVIAHDIKLRDVAKINNATDKWKLTDFLECYIKLGNEHYNQILDFTREYDCNLRISIPLLMKNTPKGGGRYSEIFKDGLFECHYLQEAQELIKTSNFLFPEYSFNRSPDLLLAIQKLNAAGKWDLEVMREKIKKNRSALSEQLSVKSWIFHLEQIYNIRNQKIYRII